MGLHFIPARARVGRHDGIYEAMIVQNPWRQRSFSDFREECP